jgi:hypothetical protein
VLLLIAPSPFPALGNALFNSESSLPSVKAADPIIVTEVPSSPLSPFCPRRP